MGYRTFRECPEEARKVLAMTSPQPEPGVSASEAYREKLFSLLAGRDPMEMLGQTASALAHIVTRDPAAVLRTQPFVRKWTPNEIIGHLTDSEWVYGYRLRVILCEEDPVILGTKQDSWVSCLRHNEREPSELVEIFRTLRELNLGVWRQLPPEALERRGQHNERGQESLRVWPGVLESNVANAGRSRPFSPGSDPSLHSSPFGQNIHAARQ
jgi:hypothetical protein